MKKVMSVIMSSFLALTFVATGAAASQVDTKGEQELMAEGQKIDKAASSRDSSRVTDRIVQEWNGTLFTFEPNSAPRELRREDVQHLRNQKLGYGEISILLALTAKQPDSQTTKSMSEIRAMRQSGAGWGKLAHELGYRNLASVIRSVKATEHQLAGAAVERGQKPEKAGKPDKPEKVEKTDKIERPESLSARPAEIPLRGRPAEARLRCVVTAGLLAPWPPS